MAGTEHTTGRGVRLAQVVALVGGLAACDRAWRADTVSPRPHLGSTLEARTSFAGTILLHDMELPHFIGLANTAYFVEVSRDRLRFHVTLRHKWEDMSDPSRWRVTLLDSRGVRRPARIDRRVVEPVTQMFSPGLPREVNLQPMFAVTVYRGEGDYTFYAHDVLPADVRWVELTLARPGYELDYVWQFPAAGMDDDVPVATDGPSVATGR